MATRKRFIWNGIETNYEISSDGKVFNVKTNRELKGTLARNEYKSVQLSIEGKRKSFMIHRLVAELFCENPNNYTIVDHIDRDRYNNDYTNLRWVDTKTNANNKNFNQDSSLLLKTTCENLEGFTQIFSSNYGINKEGQVVNFKTKKFLKGGNRNGYLRVKIDGKVYSIHRLVWETFKGKIPDRYYIDHIDGNRSNNSLSNLRMVSQSENMENAYLKGHAGQKKIKQYTLDGEFVEEYDSVVRAAKAINNQVTTAAIGGAAKRKGSSAGFYWIFSDSNITIEQILENNKK